MAGKGKGDLLTFLLKCERRRKADTRSTHARIEHGNGWLKPAGYPSQVRCWRGSANSTPYPYPYPWDPHGKTRGLTHTRDPP